MANRIATYVQYASVILIVAALVVIMRVVPVDRGVEAVGAWAAGLGMAGPLVIGAIYILAALLFIPGSALTLVCGALFGPVKGTITVSLASTSAAALAFLIARYLARSKVEQQVKRYPKFDAIDKAIGDQGWKIIALLRLSPVVPFNLSNYLFGLTAIRFWPCVLASWAAMLPATFMYVYVGHIGSEGIATASGASSSKSPGEWAMLIVGLTATVVVTVYVTRIAGRAIRQRTEIDNTMSDPETPAPAGTDTDSQVAPASRAKAAAIAATLAVLFVAGASYAQMNQAAIRGMFGPVAATLVEAYEPGDNGVTFDHAVFNELLSKHVDADGWVDYAGMEADAGTLDGYIESIAKAPFDSLGRDEKLALLINAYNAFTLRLILDHYPIESIKKIPDAKRWDDRRWKLVGKRMSLNDIEHKEIRPKFREPRIHFALVCAAIGCPKLRNEAYTGSRLEEQLADQTRYAHTHDRWLRFDAGGNTIHLTKLYDWYGGDFKQVAGSVIQFAARHCRPLEQALGSGKKIKTRWLDYDWTLNDKKNRP